MPGGETSTSGSKLTKEQRLYLLFKWCLKADKYSPHPKEDKKSLEALKATIVPPWFLTIRKQRTKEYSAYEMKATPGTSSKGSQKRNSALVPTLNDEIGPRPVQVDSQLATAWKRSRKSANDNEDEAEDVDTDAMEVDDDHKATSKPKAKHHRASQPASTAKRSRNTANDHEDDAQDEVENVDDSMEVDSDGQATIKSKPKPDRAVRGVQGPSILAKRGMDTHAVAENPTRRSSRMTGKQRAAPNDVLGTSNRSDEEDIDELNSSIYEDSSDQALQGGLIGQGGDSHQGKGPKGILRAPASRSECKDDDLAASDSPGVAQVPERAEVPATAPDYDYIHFDADRPSPPAPAISPPLDGTVLDDHWLSNVPPFVRNSSVEYRPVRPDFDAASFSTTINWNFNESRSYSGIMWDAISEVGECSTQLGTRVTDILAAVSELQAQTNHFANKEITELRQRGDCIEAYLLERYGTHYLNYPHPGRGLFAPARFAVPFGLRQCTRAVVLNRNTGVTPHHSDIARDSPERPASWHAGDVSLFSLNIAVSSCRRVCGHAATFGELSFVPVGHQVFGQVIGHVFGHIISKQAVE
ncbi:hypothetical protein LXA43DRAFT_1096400 [Ganoderma leucocontextum]|nr:hypothetical protein LXA43DRAFT_1096400 [Ganoderma leucocontextum]